MREVPIKPIGDQGDGIAKVERGFVVIIPGATPVDERGRMYPESNDLSLSKNGVLTCEICAPYSAQAETIYLNFVSSRVLYTKDVSIRG